jgi:hypothetical protein
MDCGLCGKHIVYSRSASGSAYSLPMFNGRVNWNSRVNFEVCKSCHDRHWDRERNRPRRVRKKVRSF